MITERTLKRIERSITAIALVSVSVLAYAALTTSARGDDTGGCPKGKVLFSIMDSDGIYKPVCIPANAGGNR